MKKLWLISFFIMALCLSAINSSFAEKNIAEKKKYSPLELEFPVSCRINENCWIINSDEKGTDIVVKSFKEEEKGVPVLSAQDGTVVLVNNDLKNKTASGNSVIIEHSHGWKTIYTHLKAGSIKVKIGEFAGKGKQIAELGASGSTEFPHLHFCIYNDGEFFPPFWNPLSKNDYSVKDFVIANTGASSSNPNLKSIRQGKYDSAELLNNIPSVYLWVYGFKFKKGDFLKFSLNNPKNERILNKVVEVSSNYKETFFTAQKAKPEGGWQPGAYKGKIEFIRAEAGIAKEYVFSFNIKEPEKPVDPELKKKQEEEKKLEEQRKQNRKKIFIYKKLYDQGKLPDTVPDNVKERLKGI